MYASDLFEGIRQLAGNQNLRAQDLKRRKLENWEAIFSKQFFPSGQMPITGEK